MDGDAAAVLRAYRRKVAATVAILSGLVVAMLLLASAGGRQVSITEGVKGWLHQRVNTNVSLLLPLSYRLEVRVRLIRALPPRPTSVASFRAAHPIKARSYALGMLLSPRLTLAWAWLAERHGLELLQEHIAQHRARVRDSLGAALQALAPELLPDGELLADAAAAAGRAWPALHAVWGAAGSTALFWAAWALCPGLQVAYYCLFLSTGSAASQVKLLWTAGIGCARTYLEARTALRCARALLWPPRNEAVIANSLVCSCLLPAIMTLQSLAVLLVISACLPHWLAHIALLAFCFWGPPVVLALMTTALPPPAGLRHRAAAALADAPAGAAAADAAALGGAVGAVAAMAADAPAPRGDQQAATAATSPFWPPPLVVPAQLDEACRAPWYALCPITFSIMTEPAVTASGATYERAAIMQWLASHRRDPLTSRPLAPDQIGPNLALRAAIEAWLEQQQQHQQLPAQRLRQPGGRRRQAQQQCKASERAARASLDAAGSGGSSSGGLAVAAGVGADQHAP